MNTFLDILFLADIIAIAVMMHIFCRCIASDSEKRRLKRREKYRKPAYAEMEIRWTKHLNRDALWKAVNR